MVIPWQKPQREAIGCGKWIHKQVSFISAFEAFAMASAVFAMASEEDFTCNYFL